MALLNLFQENSYTVIDETRFSKQRKHCAFNIAVYENAEKKSLIANMVFEIDGSIIVEHVEDFDVKQLPEDKVVGKKFIISLNPEDSFLDEVKGETLCWNGERYDRSLSHNNVVWVESKQAYYLISNPPAKINYVTSREFEKFFSTQIVLEKGILKCCYDYLKSLSFAKNAVDV